MRIGLVDLAAEGSGLAANKDVSGGMGTRTTIGKSPVSKLFQLLKSRGVRVPLLSFAYMIPILRNAGHSCHYFNGLPGLECDIYLINSSIIDYRHELRVAEEIRQKYSSSAVGFFGTFASVKPELFMEHSDFVIRGEVEAYLLYKGFTDTAALGGILEQERELDIDHLPTPDFSSFDYRSFSYRPALVRKPFVTLLASRGCPYTCSYYCPYTIIQGNRYHPRSIDLLMSDIEAMVRDYGARSIQFRDPIFTLDRDRTIEFCRRMTAAGLDLHWGCETRPDRLDRELIHLMHEAGLRNINLGIESSDEAVMSRSRRIGSGKDLQRELIEYCDETGVKVTAFYMIGMEGDDEDSVRRTFQYARELNTHLAQVTISTPYPGTEFFDDLERDGRILTEDFQMYDINHLVFSHDNFTPERLLRLKEKFYSRYYLRPGYIWKFLRCQLRDILS